MALRKVPFSLFFFCFISIYFFSQGMKEKRAVNFRLLFAVCVEAAVPSRRAASALRFDLWGRECANMPTCPVSVARMFFLLVPCAGQGEPGT